MASTTVLLACVLSAIGLVVQHTGCCAPNTDVLGTAYKDILYSYLRCLAGERLQTHATLEHLYSPMPVDYYTLHCSEDDTLGATHCRLALGYSV